jgi:hypothetical protein
MVAHVPSLKIPDMPRQGTHPLLAVPVLFNPDRIVKLDRF